MSTKAESSSVPEVPQSAQTRLYYRWSIISKPPDSRLDAHDLWSSRTPEVSFLPDAPGEYVFCFKIFHQGKVTTEQIRIWVEDASETDPNEERTAGDNSPASKPTVASAGGREGDPPELPSSSEKRSEPLNSAVTKQSVGDARLRIRLSRPAA
ncbi:hypothetical protein CCYA_CCYA04G1197 [Cyanidiococcus yangmingshanensis]|nr:hypothetical protein CCYA_CCYA04G1197 [Cyanidiococcus yangmingshanensis]